MQTACALGWSLCGLYYDVDTSVDTKGEGHYGADYTYDLNWSDQEKDLKLA